MQTKRKVKNRLRRGIQIGIFSLIAVLAVGKGLKDAGALPWWPEISLHAICPFGGVVTIYQFIATGDFLPKLHSAAFILMAVATVVLICSLVLK